MKTAIHAAECINTGCRPVILRSTLPAHETVAFFDGHPELAKDQLLVSPLMECFDDQDRKVMQVVEWLRVVAAEPDHDGVIRRATVLRGANHSVALSWPRSTVFHALPLTGPLAP